MFIFLDKWVNSEYMVTKYWAECAERYQPW